VDFGDNRVGSRLRWRVSACFLIGKEEEKTSRNYLPKIVASSGMEEKGIELAPKVVLPLSWVLDRKIDKGIWT
jgi:hypothetical protein